ncbi:ABC transporter ATP-binding protein [Betaproteobacteria bacterium PRO7]|jgi:branched-chain amino acid transport system ATP-binding protein|nr:ABC transporter ATP-binding protein [Betaproteobacteria bacterium PRO7]GIL04551.1 MAG: ABC transporter ATP-binding protein [Betaproteobacteria bacterium]
MALLDLEGLSRRFGGVLATDGVSLQLGAGELLALIGPNGAGKSTLVNQLSGALRSDAGTIRFEGEDITALPQHARVARGIARSYQITNVFRRFTALDNVALAVQARSGSSLRFWQPVARERALFDAAADILRDVGLGARMDVPAGALAHGEQRQLEVALALATGPRLLLLDEPLAGMGPDESETMIALIAELKGKLAILLVEHDMDAVFRLADRIAVLVYGRVIARDAPAAIRANAEVRRAYLGEEAASEAAP